MLLRTLLLSVSSALISISPAFSAGCDGILSLTRNLSFEQKSIVIAQDIYSDYCQGSQLKQNASFDLGLNVIIEQVPIGLKLGSGNVKEKVEHLCSSYENWYSLNAESVSSAVSTSDRAIEAWQACKALEREDVFFSVIPGREVVGFGVRRGSDVIDFLGMEYKPNEIVCFGPFGEDGAQVVIDGSTRFTLTSAKEQPVTCRRNLATDSDGLVYLPAIEVAIMAEGKPSLVVPLPRDEKYEPSFASEIKSQLETLQNEIFATKDELNAARSQLQQSINQVDKRMTDRNQSILAKVRLIMRGEHQRHAEPYYRTIWCGDPNDYARDLCGSRPYHLEQIYQRSGDRCGYTYYVVACTN